MYQQLKQGRTGYGSVNNLTGLTAGLFGVYVNNSNNTGLGNGNWYSCSYDFVKCNRVKHFIACAIAAVISGRVKARLTWKRVEIAKGARLVAFAKNVMAKSRVGYEAVL